MKLIVMKLKNVFLYSMEDQKPTVLFYDGSFYRIDKQANEGKTIELREILKERREKEKGLDKGDIIARTPSGSLVYENPLKEMIELKKGGKMTSLSMAGVIRKYSPNLKPTTVAIYRSGYQDFINKSKNADIRLNEIKKQHETVTDKDIKKVDSVLSKNESLLFDEILKELDMTEYKLKLILKDTGKYESFVLDDETHYKLKVNV